MPQLYAPEDLVRELRHFHATKPDLLDGDLKGFRLTLLPWGSNNRCYAWKVPYLPDDDPDATVCLKLYTTGPPDRAWCEALALSYVATQGITDAPRFLWQDGDRIMPAATMTLLPGDPVSAWPMAPAHVLNEIVAAVGRIHALPLGRLGSRSRANPPSQYLDELTVVWPKALDITNDSLSRDLLALVTRWLEFDDVDTLTQPAKPVLSPGNANLDHWLWDTDTNRVHLIDWSAVGRSDIASDAADLIEHPTARIFSEDDWISLLPELGIHDSDTRRRFLAAQRASALHWLRERWNEHHRFPNKLADQRDRVHTLLSQPWA